jgi:hypothetical protein
VPNRREARRKAREAAAQQRQAAERADAALAARSGTRLADWAPITSEEEAALVWDVLTAVMRAHPDGGGMRTAMTGDDRWLVVAYPAPAHDGTALLRLPQGRMACENWRIEVRRA